MLNGEMKSESGFSLAIASQPFIELQHQRAKRTTTKNLMNRSIREMEFALSNKNKQENQVAGGEEDRLFP